MGKAFRTLAGLATMLCAASGGLAAQSPDEDARLEVFIQEFARVWQTGQVAAIVEMIADDDLLLDTGSGTEASNGRHTAAALRLLFNERETTRLEVLSVTVAGVDPPRGFGELSWTFHDRDVPGEPSRSVYVAAIRTSEGWRVSELRLLP